MKDQSAKSVSDNEFEAVVSLPIRRRYEHFLKQVADWEIVWSLGDDEGWALMGDEQGREIVPFWPHERYASACATGGFADYRPRFIGLDDFLSKWLPGLERDKRLVAIFPGLDMKGAVIDPETLKADLETEREQYE